MFIICHNLIRKIFYNVITSNATRRRYISDVLHLYLLRLAIIPTGHNIYLV